MKTIIHLIIVLVFAFNGILVGQEKTSISPPLKPTIKYNNEGIKKKTKSNQKKSDNISNPEKRIQLLDKQIAELEKLKSGVSNVSEVEALSMETTNFKTRNSQSLIKEVDDYFDLQIESNLLIKKYTELLDESKVEKNQAKREKLIETAVAVFQAYEVKQIDISNVFGRINYVKFEENKATINLLLYDYDGGIVYKSLIYKLCNEADFAMEMALEMREEANAQPNNKAMLDNYCNAEEKELMALTKQDKAIEILEKTTLILFTNWGDGLAFNEK